MDLAKYRTIFVEDSAENLGEMSRALLELEKEPANRDAIDLIFRMAHSTKGMAASLGYDSITEIAHHLEGRMQTHRDAGCVTGAEELSLLIRGLEALETMVAVVRDSGEVPPPIPDLVAALSTPVPEPTPDSESPKKKVWSR